MTLRSSLLTTLILLILAAVVLSTAVAAPPVAEKPTDGWVPLASSNGWNATLILDNGGVGVWTVKSYPIFDDYGSPEVIGLDDEGRCHVLVSYSGRWTPKTTVHDGTWLGGLTYDDVDPRIPGGEIYTGSQKGNVYQVVGHDHGVLDSKLLAFLPGHEIHTIVAGDLDPRTKGREVIVFTRPGGMYRLTPDGKNGAFTTTLLEEVPGRVRDALVLPARRDETPVIATVSRAGWLRTVQLTEKGPVWKTIFQSRMGQGRLAMNTIGGTTVLYTTLDDGRVLRHAQTSAGWDTTTIYAGPQGPRGIVAGRFDADPTAETIAVFGYSGKVQLLTRRTDGRWQAETIFVDTKKGHWLTVAELDGRNATQEIVSSGYSGRIVMMTRPAGYGIKDLTVDPDDEVETSKRLDLVTEKKVETEVETEVEGK